jgi:U6 snRNA-associated Sm-like protein LSm1
MERLEDLSLNEPPGGAQQQAMPPPVPQLPPQMFTTAAQLLDLTDSESSKYVISAAAI